MYHLLAASLLIISQIHYIELAPTENYPYSEALASNYKLYWKYNATHITFETHVQTHGSVGFGISKTGLMFPADVVVGFVSNNQGTLYDRHTIAHVPPIMDKSQDWVLLESMQTGNDTVLKFSRALDTNDSEDVPIKAGVTHVIWDFTKTVPQPPTQVVYHGTNRGSKDITLINSGGVPVGK
ncbi:DBH-like monooxygenase protein 1 homolog [Mercenaria mercenaria]|uniref:DBH-like monooxygenase protein 1 homolog n=1 Tax=Mercenaria mercenaria TaxID=6596 RepID=UPI00234FA1C0|nr:DBH-like monooxygenase protein 1 homolog [Mercenaria mercenaria]